MPTISKNSNRKLSSESPNIKIFYKYPNRTIFELQTGRVWKFRNLCTCFRPNRPEAEIIILIYSVIYLRFPSRGNNTMWFQNGLT